MARFFAAQLRNLISTWGEIDGVCVVPSTKGVVPHPLSGVYESADVGLPLLDVLVRGEGPLRHRYPHRDGFECNAEGGGRRVVVLDDVYTTGATAQSAAYALKSAGYEVLGIVVIARRINPDFTPQVRNLWESCSSKPYDFGRSFV